MKNLLFSLLLVSSASVFAWEIPLELPAGGARFDGCYQTVEVNGVSIPRTRANTGYIRHNRSQWLIDFENQKAYAGFNFSFFLKGTRNRSQGQGGMVYLQTVGTSSNFYTSTNAAQNMTFSLEVSPYANGLVEARYQRKTPTPQQDADDVFILRPVRCR